MSSTSRTSPIKSKNPSTTTRKTPKRPHYSFQPMTIQRRRELSQQLHLPSFKSVYFGREKEYEAPKRQHKTKGDGNCFFRAISYFLTDHETSHLRLRDAVVQHMSEKGEKLDNYLQQNVTKYLNSSRMAENGVWATDAEIMATASLLQTDIVVYTHYGKELKWLCYPASFTLEKLSIGAVYLTNLHEHFDVVINVQ
ncbi:uncharacterized protein [Haliotis cracherodii]|uniref:uncharacterized protein n=1 Tax=Haliotis cracherodii TaxID=6455 RepID=UPI0039EB27F4